jgi:hypothetical protein
MLLYSIEDFLHTTLPPLLRPEMCFNPSGTQYLNLKQTETQEYRTIRGLRLELRNNCVQHSHFLTFVHKKQQIPHRFMSKFS